MSDNRFRRELAEHEVLFRQGDKADRAYVVEAGELEVFLDRNGERDVLSRVGPGAVLGEMALLDDSVRMATVSATQPSVLRVLTREHLNERLDVADPLVRHILQLVSNRYREVVQRFTGTEHSAALPPRPLHKTGDQNAVIDELRLEQDLEMALENGEFALHYQPIMRLADKSVAGFEALIRWQHPKRGLIRPDAFIPLAEQSDLIVRMGRWVTSTAIEALALFDRVEPVARRASPLFMTVNLSPRQFTDDGLVQMIADSLKYRGLAPQRLRLEITESSLLDRFKSAATLMQQCQALGVGLSVDDFGTGYSALSYLYRLPVSSVKFPRRFIRDLADYPASRQIVGAVSRLAGDLGMDTVCEGIETAEQESTICELAVPYGQGFHYAPGLALPAAISFLRHTRRVPAPRPADTDIPELRVA